MTYFAAVYTTWILEDNFPNFRLQTAYCNLIVGWFMDIFQGKRHGIIEKWLQTREVSFSDDVVLDVVEVVLAC